MPLYEYHCKSCGENTEILQKHSDAPEKTCPFCHQDKLEKQISSTSFQLKGGGWYVTDFKNKKENKNTSTEIKSDKKETTETSKTVETKKPEKTPDPSKSET